MRILERVLDAIDRPGRNGGGLECFQEVVAPPLRGQRCDRLAQGVAVGDAAGIAGPLRRGIQPDDGAETLELGVIADRQDDPAIAHRYGVIGRDIGVAVAHAFRGFAGGEIIHRLIGQHAGHAVQQRHVDMLAPPALVALGQGGLDGDGAVEPGEDIGEGDAHFLRRAVWLAGQVHDPAHRLDDEVIARPVGIGAGLAETGDRAIDQAWVEGGQAVIVQPVLGQSTALEILDHHIGIGDKAANGVATVFGAEIDHGGALAAITGVEIGRACFPVLTFDEGRSPFAGIIAVRAFDLEHIGAKIGQGLPGPGSGQNTGQFENAQAFERRLGGGVTHPHCLASPVPVCRVVCAACIALVLANRTMKRHAGAA